MTGRAKWDAWNNAGTTWQGRRGEAEEEYLNRAKGFGWSPGEAPPPSVSTGDEAEPTVEELLSRPDEISTGVAGGRFGMGPSVSSMAIPKPEVNDGGRIHGFAVSGDVAGLESLLEADPSIDLNEKDEYGFTALHLASDRGNTDVVKVLVSRGADLTLKDEDGLTALDLAQEASRDDIAALLESSSS